MKFLDKLNSWSWVHVFGSYGLCLTLFLISPTYIWLMAVIVFLLGLFNELFLDGHFPKLGLFDPRGGDWYDIIYNTIGIVCAIVLWKVVKR
jgi:hypothetical protein